jgi:serine phosphatase RsbU (regulator of sigma subunit)/pSer/pThr/pTyr-binding forkhead associated (FHA) protein
MQAAISVHPPGGAGTHTLVKSSPFLIGRQSGNHLVLRDNRISRVHARIVADAGAHWIEDAQSRSGTFVNGRRVEGRHKLAPGEAIEFGVEDGYRIVFLRSEEAAVDKLTEHITGSGISKLRALTEVARAVHGSLSMDEVLEAVVDAALSVSGGSRALLYLVGDAGLDLRVSRDAGELPPPTELVARAIRSRGEIVIQGPGICVPLARVRTGSSQETSFAPLTEAVGALYLEGELGAGNEDILRTLALEASTVIENARLLEQERDKLRLDEELRIARDIQRTLLPAKLPRTGWFRAAASTVPSLLVGGDYYEVSAHGPDCWVFVVADVSGKGVSSALMASLLQGALIAGPGDPAGIAALLGRINAYVYERAEGEKYATLFYGALHRDGTLNWCSAGHGQAALVLPGGAVRPLGSTALPIGMLDLGGFDVTTEVLPDRAKVVVYSDGVSDAEDPGGNPFGVARVASVLRGMADADCEALHQGVEAAVADFAAGTPQRDDRTLMVVEYRR